MYVQRKIIFELLRIPYTQELHLDSEGVGDS